MFHSFLRFDIPNGETATFDRSHTGDADTQAVQHVVARVSEANPSRIAGTLRSTYTDADVLLINPAGVTFDDKARIDVPASLRISTADYVKLGSDGRFDAADPSRDALSMAPPSAFGVVAGIGLRGSFLHRIQAELYWGAKLQSVPEPLNHDLQDSGVSFRVTVGVF